MNSRDDFGGGKEPDLDRWLADLTDSVNDDYDDDDIVAFLRPYRNWDGQEPLGDYVARATRDPQQTSPHSTGAHVLPLRPLGSRGEDTLTAGVHAEGGGRRAAQLRTKAPPHLLVLPTQVAEEPGDARKTRRRSFQEKLDAGREGRGGAERWKSIAAAVIAAALVAVVAVGGFAVFREQPPDPPIANQSNTSFSFTSPADGAKVTSPLILRGTAKLPPDRVLWILIKAHAGDPRYFLTTDAPIAVDGTGRWASRLKLGAGPQDIGKTSTLYAVTSPPDGTLDEQIGRRPAGEYSVRLADIPADCTLVGQIDLTLAG